jgi:hypothetical protein
MEGPSGSRLPLSGKARFHVLLRADYASFRERFGREFLELDTRFEALTESEAHLGDFERR